MQSAIKLFALSFTFTGLYFLIYFVNFFIASALTSNLKSVRLMEIWVTCLFGLGLSMLYYNSKQKRYRLGNVTCHVCVPCILKY